MFKNIWGVPHKDLTELDAGLNYHLKISRVTWYGRDSPTWITIHPTVMDCGVEHFHSIMGLCHTRNQKSNSIERKINDKRKVVDTQNKQNRKEDSLPFKLFKWIKKCHKRSKIEYQTSLRVKELGLNIPYLSDSGK